MRRAIPVLFLIIYLFWTGMTVLNKFPPGEEEIQIRYLAWSKATGVVVPAAYAREMPFPLPVLLLSAVPVRVLISPIYFRIPNLVLGILTLALLWLLVFREEPKFAGATLVIAAVTPWLVWIVMSDFPAVLTLFLAVLTFTVNFCKWPAKIKTGLIILLLILSGLTGISGLVFTMIFGVWWALSKNRKTEKILLLLIVFLLTCGIAYRLWFDIAGQSFIRTQGITLSGISEQVDLRVRYEFKLNNYQNIVPLGIKRLVYNKIYFGYRTLVSQIFNVFSLEKIAFPTEADATVTRSMWNSKGLPWLLFWQLILGLWGMYHFKDLNSRLKNLCLLFFGWGAVSMYLTGNNFLASGMGIVIPMAIISALALRHIPKIVLYIGGLIALIGLAATYHYFLFNELYWRDNRPQVQTIMAQMAVKYRADQVTTILGRSFLYYAWLTRMPPGELWQGTAQGNIYGNIKFDHFELKNNHPPAGQIYVGFPGEFLGDKKIENRNDFKHEDLPKNYLLLDSYQPRDTVSFSNGDEIWTVKTL